MNTRTLTSWNELLPSAPTHADITEYLWSAASKNDVPLVQSVLSYAKHNNFTIDITHPVHLACTYARMQMLDALDQYTSLTPHHVMTGLYAAGNECQSEVLHYLFQKAHQWENFYQHVNANELLNFVCIPGNVQENKVLECIKILEPLLIDPECTHEVVRLIDFGYPNAALYLLKYSNTDVLQQTLEDLEKSTPNPILVQKIKDTLFNYKLRQEVGDSKSNPHSRKI